MNNKIEKPDDITSHYLGNIFGGLAPTIGDCEINFCRKDINLTDDYFQHVHSDAILCSWRCVKLHWDARTTDKEQ